MRKLTQRLVASLGLLTSVGFAQPAASGPYKVVNVAKVGGAGSFDYVTADADGRRLYVPRGNPANHVSVFDLDTLKPVGEIAQTAGVRGAAVDPKSHQIGRASCRERVYVLV